MKREKVALTLLGERIKELRKKKNITQIQLAKEMETTLDTVKNWEQSYNYPKIDTLIEISKFFQCDTDYLLGKQETPIQLYDYIGKLTRLSEEAISNIMCASDDFIRVLNLMIESPELLNFIQYCSTVQYNTENCYTTENKPHTFTNGSPAGYKIEKRQLFQADTMELYNLMLKYIKALRKKNGLDTY